MDDDINIAVQLESELTTLERVQVHPSIPMTYREQLIF